MSLKLSSMDMAIHCIEQLNEKGALQNNVMALVNASAIDLQKKDFRAAHEKLKRALETEPRNFAVNFNLGLLALRTNDIGFSNEQFQHLNAELLVKHSIQHNHVFFHIAKLQEKRRNSTLDIQNFRTITSASLQSYLKVLGALASELDSRILEMMGIMFEQMQNHHEASQYYNEAFRINPSDIAIANSVGSYYIKLQATEKAIYYYERAVLANPYNPNIMLRIASCLRSSYMQSKQCFAMYEKIYTYFPNNLACLLSLVQAAKSLRIELHEKYSLEYSRLQKLQMERLTEQRLQNDRISLGTSRRNSKIQSFSSQTEEHTSDKNFDELLHSVRINFNEDQRNQETESNIAYLDQIHHDPLGPPTERPKTGMVQASHRYEKEEAQINAISILPL